MVSGVGGADGGEDVPVMFEPQKGESELRRDRVQFVGSQEVRAWKEPLASTARISRDSV